MDAATYGWEIDRRDPEARIVLAFKEPVAVIA